MSGKTTALSARRNHPDPSLSATEHSRLPILCGGSGDASYCHCNGIGFAKVVDSRSYELWSVRKQSNTARTDIVENQDSSNFYACCTISKSKVEPSLISTEVDL